MMGHQQVEQAALFYEFSLEKHIPADHVLRSVDRFVDLQEIRQDLAPFYSSIGRSSIDPELMIRMLLIGYDQRTNFSELQADLAKVRQDRMLFYALDILFHNGEDLRGKPQINRKQRLKELIDMLEGFAPASAFKGLSKGTRRLSPRSVLQK
jgi:hypothetical protein